MIDISEGRESEDEGESELEVSNKNVWCGPFSFWNKSHKDFYFLVVGLDLVSCTHGFETRGQFKLKKKNINILMVGF
jgi:hypothetical protein